MAAYIRLLCIVAAHKSALAMPRYSRLPNAYREDGSFRATYIGLWVIGVVALVLAVIGIVLAVSGGSINGSNDDDDNGVGTSSTTGIGTTGVGTTAASTTGIGTTGVTGTGGPPPPPGGPCQCTSLNVTGNSFFSGVVRTYGSVQLWGPTFYVNATTIEFARRARFDLGLNVSAGGMDVTGPTTLRGPLVATQGATVVGGLTVPCTADPLAQPDTVLCGDVRMPNGTLTVTTGDIDVRDGSLTVDDRVTTCALNVTCNATFSGSVTIDGNVTLTDGSIRVVDGTVQAEAYLRGDGTEIDTLDACACDGMLFGDGADGVLTVPNGNTTTLARDGYFSNVTVNFGGRLRTNGYRLFVANTLTVFNGGLVDADGEDAPPYGTVNIGFGNVTVTGRTLGGRAGNVGTLGSGAPGYERGQSGALVCNDSFIIATGATNTSGDADPTLSAARHGGGDAGVAGVPGEVPAIGGRSIANPPEQGGDTTYGGDARSAWLFRAMDGRRIMGGAGGAGGNGPCPTLSNAGQPRWGGGGGAGGGVVAVFARRLFGSGLIAARGGDGGEPSGGPTTSFGGGGGGGVVIVVACNPTGIFGQGGFGLMTTSVIGGEGGGVSGISQGADGQNGTVAVLTGCRSGVRP